jgi:predicted PurR-regulated permease PerM
MATGVEHGRQERTMTEPEQEPEGLFHDGELRLFRYTAVMLSFVLLVGLMGLSIWVIGSIMSFFSSILLPLAIAGVLALVLHPVVEFLEDRVGLSRLVAVVTLFLVFTTAVLALAGYVLPAAIAQTRSFVEALPDMLAQLDQLARRFPRLMEAVGEMLTNRENGAPAVDLEAAGERVRGYIGLIVGLTFMPLFLFFALLSGDRIEANVKDLLSVFSTETEREVLLLGTLFIEYVTAFFRGQLVIALIMGALMATGFTLIGLPAAIILGLFLGLLNIVPYLGAIVGLVTVLPVAYIQPDGGLPLVGLTLLVFAVVQTIESLLLTPKIMADRSGLHPAVVVISIFFWGAVLGGLIGMILAVPLSAFVATVWRHLKSHLRRTVVADDAVRDLEDAERRWLHVEGTSPSDLSK